MKIHNVVAISQTLVIVIRILSSKWKVIPKKNKYLQANKLIL